MKLFRQIKSRKGFTLTECLIAIAVFVVMSAIVMQMLAVCIASKKTNYKIEQDMDKQIQEIVANQALLERETVTKTMKFLTGGSGSKDINVTFDVYKPSDSNSVGNRLELNTFKVDGSADDSKQDNKSETSAGMVTASDHIYGTKNIKEIYVEEKFCTETGDNKRVKLLIKIMDKENGILKQGVSNSIKISLPDDSTKLASRSINGSENLKIFSLSGNVIRFSDKDAGNNGPGQNYEAEIEFTVPKDSTEYESFSQFFGLSNKDSKSVTFHEKDDVPGVYSKE